MLAVLIVVQALLGAGAYALKIPASTRLFTARA